MPGVAVLPQAVGYAVVLGIGFFFAALMLGMSWLFNRYSDTKSGSAEEFTSASRSVKPGLVAAGIVSAWTWAATLLQSSAVGYRFGISGPYWYAAGACVQVMLFAMNAAKLKKHAPSATTFLQVICARWGVAAHVTFMFFAILTNVIVSSMLILGGSAAVTDLTGINTIAACFLIPISVCTYVFVGGIRSALFCDYVHTMVLFVFILVFMFTAFTTSDKIGSPTRMWELLQEAAARSPVPNNAEGSYLTMRSVSGLIFGVVNVIGNFSTVFLDQSYWQRAVASKPSTAVKAFSLGGSAWFAVPFGMATTLGLTAVALTAHPDFPGYPSPLTASEVSAGLPAPAAAAALMGQTGAILILVVLFLAVVSTSAAEMVAVAGIGTFDIYKRYINPNANSKQILLVNRGLIVSWAVLMGVFGLIWYYISVSMGWLYVVMGTLIGSCVVPVALAIISPKANKWGCIIGAWAGLASGLVAWMITTSSLYGEITVATTGADYCVLAGNLAAIGVGAICSVVGTLVWPENCDFAQVEATIAGYKGTENEDAAPESPIAEDEKKNEPLDVSANVVGHEVEEQGGEHHTPAGESVKALDKAFRFAATFSVSLALILLIVIPLPLFFSSHIFGPTSFTVWIAVAFIWVFYAICATVIYPLYEYRSELGSTFAKMRSEISKK